MKSIILTRDFLEKMDGPQLDVLTFFVYGKVGFESRAATIDDLTGAQLSPSVMETLEKMLELVKKL